MDIDYGRQCDLEELYQDRKSAPVDKKKAIDLAIRRIMEENGAYSHDRDILIRAMRVGDRRTMKYYQEKINRKQKETRYGHSI